MTVPDYKVVRSVQSLDQLEWQSGPLPPASEGWSYSRLLAFFVHGSDEPEWEGQMRTIIQIDRHSHEGFWRYEAGECDPLGEEETRIKHWAWLRLVTRSED